MDRFGYTGAEPNVTALFGASRAASHSQNLSGSRPLIFNSTKKMSGKYYLGVDVGTGSARVCAIDESGEIVGIQTRDIKTWNDKADYYVSPLTLCR